jgi:2-polyprenyl-6-methoxyphenol hydroxylase-like FAD-dependent oxidoreductase
MAHTFDVCIRGAGIVGRTLALLLARERLRVALVAPQRAEAPQADVRAYALNASSKQLLESLRTWPDAAHVTAVRHMEVHGDVDGSVHFDALAQGVDALAWIVDVPALEQRLAEAVRYQPQIEVVAAPVEEVKVDPTASDEQVHACVESLLRARPFLTHASAAEGGALGLDPPPQHSDKSLPCPRAAIR